MYTLDLCRICLSNPVHKDIQDLKICENDSGESYVHILLFCLDIQVVINSAISTKLCGKCYKAILTYYRFKTLALRNDHYLRTIKQVTVKLEHITTNTWECNENDNTKDTHFETEISQNSLNYDIKDEPQSLLEIDDTVIGFEVNNQVKVENVDFESGNDCPLTMVTKPMEMEKNDIEETHFDTEITQNSLNYDIKDESQSLLEIDDIVIELEVNNEVKVENVDSESDDDSPLTTVTKPMETEKKPSPINENKISVEGARRDKEVNTNRSKISQDYNINLKAATEHECNICNYTTNNAIIFKLHMKSHSTRRPHKGEKLYACEICDKKLRNKSHFVAHIRIHTGEKPYVCKVCNKNFTLRRNLKNHVKIHTSEKPYGCKVCDKKFTWKGNLVVHIRTHTGEKPYVCDVCNKKFIQMSDLKKHIRIHTGEKLYACAVCDKNFTRRSALQIHIRTHTGEKPYACDVCDKKFALTYRLQTHMRIHTGEKPYACEVCDKKFALSSRLQTHMRAHTGEKRNACETCDKKFTHKSTLRKHIIRMHT